MATWSSTEPTDVYGDCSPWGQTTKQTTTSGSLISLFLKRSTSVTDDTDDRRPVIGIDMLGGATPFPGDSADIVSATLALYCTLESTSGDAVDIHQVNPQCLNVSPSSTDAAAFDQAACTWLQMAGAPQWTWFNAGVDVFAANTFQQNAPTAQGTWTLSNSGLAEMCKVALDDHGGILLVRLKWADEGSGATEDCRFASAEHTTHPAAILTVTYTEGIAIHRRRIEEFRRGN